ncbi:MAG: hypothetical protein PHP44_05610 [Kiritimatiellae bacterium]|nr:hypothetical protein [Kiritimatiellia bacterium]MDD4735565.1 hypothetical protein [Kiritimatiellia bacterium]
MRKTARASSARHFLMMAACLTIAGMLPACSREPQAPPPSPDGSPPRDYRQMLDRVHQRNAYNHSLDTVKEAVQRFQVELGRLPTNLIELVRYRYIDEFPQEIPPGYTFGYDATRGYVTFMKTPEGDAQPPPAQ